MKGLSSFLNLCFGIILLLLSAGACQSGSSSSTGGSSSSGDALTVYTYRLLPGQDSVFQRFEQRSGIKLEAVEIPAGELAARLRQEGAASPADIVIFPEVSMAIRARQEGLLQAYELPNVDQYFKDVLGDDQGYWTGLTRIIPAVAYSRERLKPTKLNTWVDLAMPRFQGKVLVPAADDPFLQSLVASFIIHNGEQAARAWVTALARNFARPPRGNSMDQLRGLAAGEGDVAITNASDLGYLRYPLTYQEYLIGEGSDLIILKNGQFNTHINVSCATVPTGGDVEKAVAFLEYMTSKEAQMDYPRVAQEHPVNVMAIPSDFIIEELGPVEEDDLELNLLGQYNALAAKVLEEAGW